jgi:hypothetical protein
MAMFSHRIRHNAILRAQILIFPIAKPGVAFAELVTRILILGGPFRFTLIVSGSSGNTGLTGPIALFIGWIIIIRGPKWLRRKPLHKVYLDPWIVADLFCIGFNSEHLCWMLLPYLRSHSISRSIGGSSDRLSARLVEVRCHASFVQCALRSLNF